MRLLLFAFLSVVMVSCGDKSSSSSSPSRPGLTPQQREEDSPYSIVTQEADLMDTALEVPVQVTGDKIIFQKSISNSTSGLRSTCSLGVSAGEAYSYQLSGGSLVVTTPSGQNFNMTRVGSGNSLFGVWHSKGYEGNLHVTRRLSFVGEDKVIMRSHCEG